MKIRAISFDLEGPLVNMEPLHHGGHIAAAKDVGLRLTIDECLAKIPHFIGGPDEKIAEEIAQLAGRADHKYVLERTNFHFHSLLNRTKVELRPGALEVISRLQESGFPISIGSALNKLRGEMLTKGAGLDRLFSEDKIIFAEDVQKTKPDPDVYLVTAERMGVRPDEQLVFEDSPRGALAASAARSVVVGMPIYWNHHTVAELIKSGARRVFPDWREVDIDQLLINLERES